MWVRGISGVVLCLIGAVWFTQGVGALHGSVMTGHAEWSIIGALLFAAGVVLVIWAGRVRQSRISEND